MRTNDRRDIHNGLESEVKAVLPTLWQCTRLPFVVTRSSSNPWLKGISCKTSDGMGLSRTRGINYFPSSIATHITNNQPLDHHRQHYSHHSLIPISRSQIHTNPLPHTIHNMINIPRLPLIPRRIVGLDPGLIKGNTFLHRLHVLGVVLVGVHLWVMVPDPARVLGLREAWVQLHFAPVGFLQELGVGEADFLGAGVAEEAGRGVDVSFVWIYWDGFM